MRVYVISSRTGRSFKLLRKLVHCHEFTSFDDLCNDDILVSMGYMRKIPLHVYSAIYTVNVHPGTLPELAGKHPQLRALAELKRSFTHVILHRVESDNYDQGRVLLRQEVIIRESDRDNPTEFFERTRRIGVYLAAAWLIGQGVGYDEL